MESMSFYLLKSALCFIVLFVPFQWLLRMVEHIRLNRILILFIIAASFALPLVYHEMPEFIARRISVDYNPVNLDEIKVIGYASMETGTYVSLEDNNPVSMWTVPNILFFVWLIGAIAVMIWHVVSYVHFYKVISFHSTSKERLEGGVTLYLFRDEIPSMSWMNIVMMSESDYKNNKYILLHELAHARCRHSWDRLLMSVCMSLQWFNPFVWMCSNTMNEVHEYEADRYVLSQGVDMSQYQYLLISKAAGQSSFAMVNGFNHSQLKSRISMMNHRESSLWSQTRYAVLIPMFFTAFVVSAKIVNHNISNIPLEICIMDNQDAVHPEPRLMIRPDKEEMGPLILLDGEVVESINDIDVNIIESATIFQSGSPEIEKYALKYEEARYVGVIVIQSKNSKQNWSLLPAKKINSKFLYKYY